MRKIVVVLALLATTVPAVGKTKVLVPKQYPIYRTSELAVPLFMIPPLLVFYDFQRRTNCEGDVLGLGGPGFDGKPTPPTNVMIPAQQRSVCAYVPTPNRR